MMSFSPTVDSHWSRSFASTSRWIFYENPSDYAPKGGTPEGFPLLELRSLTSWPFRGQEVKRRRAMPFRALPSFARFSLRENRAREDEVLPHSDWFPLKGNQSSFGRTSSARFLEGLQGLPGIVLIISKIQRILENKVELCSTLYRGHDLGPEGPNRDWYVLGRRPNTIEIWSAAPDFQHGTLRPPRRPRLSEPLAKSTLPKAYHLGWPKAIRIALAIALLLLCNLGRRPKLPWPWKAVQRELLNRVVCGPKGLGYEPWARKPSVSSLGCWPKGQPTHVNCRRQFARGPDS